MSPFKKHRAESDDAVGEGWVGGTVVCTLHEHFNVSKLEHISKLEDMNPENEMVIESMMKGKKNHSTLTVKYRPSIQFDQGRVYGNGVGALKGRIRRLICSEYHHYIDISNFCPTIALQVFTKQFGENVFPMLNEYVTDRGLFIQNMKQKYPQKLGARSNSEMKQLFLKGIHWGLYPDNALMYYVPHLKEWTATFRELTMKLKDIAPYNTLFPKKRG